MDTKTRITKTPGVCGGNACLQGTRYTVWGLVESRLQGVTDAEILEAHPSLGMNDLLAAWDYYENHALEIDRSLWENDAVMVEYDGDQIPIAMIQRGRALGFTDEEICDAFEPPLPTDWARSPELMGSGV